MTTLNKDKYHETLTFMIAEWLTSAFSGQSVDIRGYYEQISTALSQPRISFLVMETASQSVGAGRNSTNSYFRWFIVPIEIMVNRDQDGQGELSLLRLSDLLMKYARATSTGTPYLGSLGMKRAVISGANPGHTDKYLRNIHYLKFRVEI